MIDVRRHVRIFAIERQVNFQVSTDHCEVGEGILVIIAIVHVLVIGLVCVCIHRKRASDEDQSTRHLTQSRERRAVYTAVVCVTPNVRVLKTRFVNNERAVEHARAFVHDGVRTHICARVRLEIRGFDRLHTVLIRAVTVSRVNCRRKAAFISIVRGATTLARVTRVRVVRHHGACLIHLVRDQVTNKINDRRVGALGVHSQQRIRIVRDNYVHADTCKIIEVYLVQILIISDFQETADRDGLAERER